MPIRTFLGNLNHHTRTQKETQTPAPGEKSSDYVAPRSLEPFYNRVHKVLRYHGDGAMEKGRRKQQSYKSNWWHGAIDFNFIFSATVQ
jgi:hypothetical protein